MTRVVVVHIQTGTPAPGGWCDTCLLPSVVTIPLHQISLRGVRQIATITRCLKENP